MSAPSPSPIHCTLMEVMWLLRRLRAIHEALREDMALLEERVHSGHNGELTGAYHAMAGEESILTGIIAKLWRSIGGDTS